MNIIADRNIPYVSEVFSEFGRVTLVNGRDIRQAVLENADLLLVRSVTKVNRELIEHTPVRFVGSATIGTDHIDRDYLLKQGIGIASAPGSNARSVAEYVLCALVEVNRKLSVPLQGKIVGIIGAGHVGSRVAPLARAFGIRCLFNDPPLQRMSPDADFCALETILMEADIITMHVPLTDTGVDATLHMVDEAFVSALQPGAIFINTSRGQVVREDALYAARKKLSAIVLDVWENEPDISMETLEAADLATPHVAGYSIDGKINGVRMIYEAACAFFGASPRFSELVPAAAGRSIVIDVRDSSDPIAQALRTAYPLLEDDALLRKITRRPDRGAYFDYLRASYRRRLEFKHFTVLCTPGQITEAGILKQLGFTVEL